MKEICCVNFKCGIVEATQVFKRFSPLDSSVHLTPQHSPCWQSLFQRISEGRPVAWGFHHFFTCNADKTSRKFKRRKSRWLININAGVWREAVDWSVIVPQPGKKRMDHRKESEKLSRTLSGIPRVRVLEKLYSTNEKEQRSDGWGIQKRIIKNSNLVFNCEKRREREWESGFFKSTTRILLDDNCLSRRLLKY